jgi:hypothetical protein
LGVFDEQPLCSSRTDVASDITANKKTDNLPPILRNRLQKLPTPISTYRLSKLRTSRSFDMGQEATEQNENNQGGEGNGNKFFISDTYPTPPANTPRQTPNITLPSLPTDGEPIYLVEIRHVTR